MLDIFLRKFFIGVNYSEFWKNSIFFLKEINHENVPLWFLMLTPVVVISAIPITYYLLFKDRSIIDNFKKTNMPLYNFLYNKWYIDELYEILFVKSFKKNRIVFWKSEIKILSIGMDLMAYQNLSKNYLTKLLNFKPALFMITPL